MFLDRDEGELLEKNGCRRCCGRGRHRHSRKDERNAPEGGRTGRLELMGVTSLMLVEVVARSLLLLHLHRRETKRALREKG